MVAKALAMSTAQPQTPQGPEAITRIFQGIRVAAVLASAIELGVFRAIAEGASTAEAIGQKIGAPTRSTKVVLDCLVVSGLLTHNDGTYANTQVSGTFLVPGKPTYLGDATKVMANPMMWGAYARLADAVKAGGSVMEMHGETPEHPYWEAFAQGSGAMAGQGGRALAMYMGPWIASRGKNVRVLDVAAGSGLFGLSLAKRPDVDVTLLDWPNVLAEARTWAKKMAVDESRVHYLEGNLFELDYGGPYDVIILSHIYHHFGEEQCQQLTDKVAAALAPGGRAVILDYLFDEDLKDTTATLFRVNMLLFTHSGTTYREVDYRRWIEASKLKVAEVRPAGGLTPSTFIVAEKP